MREYDYSNLADRTWDNEIISYISKIHEYKGKQELFLRQKPVELDRLIELAKDRGGRDNITVILMDGERDTEDKAEDRSAKGDNK